MIERMCLLCNEPIGLGNTFLSGKGINRDTHRHVSCVDMHRGAAVAFGLMGMAEAVRERAIVEELRADDSAHRCIRHNELPSHADRGFFACGCGWEMRDNGSR